MPGPIPPIQARFVDLPLPEAKYEQKKIVTLSREMWHALP